MDIPGIKATTVEVGPAESCIEIGTIGTLGTEAAPVLDPKNVKMGVEIGTIGTRAAPSPASECEPEAKSAPPGLATALTMRDDYRQF